MVHRWCTYYLSMRRKTSHRCDLRYRERKHRVTAIGARVAPARPRHRRRSALSLSSLATSDTLSPLTRERDKPRDRSVVKLIGEIRGGRGLDERVVLAKRSQKSWDDGGTSQGCAFDSGSGFGLGPILHGARGSAGSLPLRRSAARKSRIKSDACNLQQF